MGFQKYVSKEEPRLQYNYKQNLSGNLNYKVDV